jgi:hypothetical protein
MHAVIEVLEGRALFAAGGDLAWPKLLTHASLSRDPAVRATVDLIDDDRSAILAAQAHLQHSSEALADVKHRGAERLAGDRQLVRINRRDPNPAAVAFANDRLKSNRRQLSADIAAARAFQRADAADARADLRDARASYRAHLRQLRTDLRNAPPVPRTPRNPPSGGGGNDDFTWSGGGNYDGFLDFNDLALFNTDYD